MRRGFRAPDFPQPRVAAAAAAVGAVGDRVQPRIILMIGFGGIERAGSPDRGHHAAVENLIGLGPRGLRLALLRRVHREYRGPIIGAAVAELAVRIGRVDRPEETANELA